MIRRALAHLHPRAQPWMTRQSYSHELMSVMSFPMGLAMVEGGVIAALALKTFDVPGWLFAAITSAPMFANLTSFFWARVARGRRKVRVINCLQLGMLAMVVAIAFVPITHAGGYMLTGLFILARCLVCGIVTVRSSVWRMNYPRRVRARLTSRLVLVHISILAIAPPLGYVALDIDPQAFRIVYPAAAVFALVGVVAYSRIRLRGEKELLRHETQRVRRVNPQAESEPYYESDPDGDGTAEDGSNDNDNDNAPSASSPHAPRETVLGILRDDWLFRRYLTCQFAAGLGMHMSQVAALHLINERLTAGLAIGTWSVEYLTSMLLTVTLPFGLAMMSMPLFARLFDRMHITAFRSMQAWWWVAYHFTTYIAALIAFGLLGVAGQTAVGLGAALGVMALARVILGISRGGGMLAFNLGHNDFAKRHNTTLYMGINVSLAGVRGIIAAFLGIGLYLDWHPRTIPLLGGIPVPGFAGLGPHIFLLTTALAFIGLLGFNSLNRAVHRTGQVAPAD